MLRESRTETVEEVKEKEGERVGRSGRGDETQDGNDEEERGEEER